MAISILSCPAGILCGQLKHSWLENQVVNKSARDVLQLRSIGWRALTDEFPERVNATRGLAEDVELGFSPAQLVDRLVALRTLPASLAGEVKAALHCAYLTVFDSVGLRASLTAAVDEFDVALRQVLERWSKPLTSTTGAGLEAAWDAVLRAARRLMEALDRLPRRIVLP